jgi:hypothetical protein
MGAIVLPPWDAAGWRLAPVLGGYVAFLTLMSTMEEERSSKGLFTFCGLAMASAPAVGLAVTGPAERSRLVLALGLSMAMSVAVAAHTVASLKSLDRATIMRNVRWGVLAIIALDATFAAAHAGRWQALCILALAAPALALLPVFRRL